MQIVLALQYFLQLQSETLPYLLGDIQSRQFPAGILEMARRSKTQEPKANEQQAELLRFLLLLRRRLLF